MDTEKRGNKHIICGAGSAHPVRRLLTAALAVCLLASGCMKVSDHGKGTGTETEKEKPQPPWVWHCVPPVGA